MGNGAVSKEATASNEDTDLIASDQVEPTDDSQVQSQSNASQSRAVPATTDRGAGVPASGFSDDSDDEDAASGQRGGTAALPPDIDVNTTTTAAATSTNSRIVTATGPSAYSDAVAKQVAEDIAAERRALEKSAENNVSQRKTSKKKRRKKSAPSDRPHDDEDFDFDENAIDSSLAAESLQEIQEAKTQSNAVHDAASSDITDAAMRTADAKSTLAHKDNGAAGVNPGLGSNADVWQADDNNDGADGSADVWRADDGADGSADVWRADDGASADVWRADEPAGDANADVWRAGDDSNAGGSASTNTSADVWTADDNSERSDNHNTSQVDAVREKTLGEREANIWRPQEN